MKLPPGMVTHLMMAPPWGGAAGLASDGCAAAVDEELPWAKHGHGKNANITAIVMFCIVQFYDLFSIQSSVKALIRFRLKAFRVRPYRTFRALLDAVYGVSPLPVSGEKDLFLNQAFARRFEQR